jgi:hypothetical protein
MELKVHCRVYESLPLVPILSQIHPLCNLPPYFPKIRSATRSSKVASSPEVFDQNFVFISQLSHALYMPRPSHSPPFTHFYSIWSSAQIINFLIMRFPPGSNILSTLLLNTLNLCSSINVRHQVSYPHKTEDRISVLFV